MISLTFQLLLNQQFLGLKNIMRKLPTRLAQEHTEIHLDNEYE